MNAFLGPTDSWNKLPTERAAVFIDWENVTGLNDAAFAEIIQTIKRSFNPTIMVGYANWCNHPRGRAVLARQNVELIQMPGLKTHKNSADIKLAVDAVELLFTVPHIRVLVLLTGDRDFIPLVQLAKRLGKEVWCFGREDSTSEQLKKACDRWTALPETAVPATKEDSSIYIPPANGIKLPEIDNDFKVSVAKAFEQAWQLTSGTGAQASQSQTPVLLSRLIDCLRTTARNFDPRVFCGRNRRTYAMSAQRLVAAGLITIDTSNPTIHMVSATEETLKLISEPSTAIDLQAHDRPQWLRFSGN